MDVEVREVEFSEHGENIGRLRATMWAHSGCDALAFEDGMLVDEFEDASHHWAAFCDRLLVGCARLTIRGQGVRVPYEDLIPDDLHGRVAVFSRLVVSKHVADAALGLRFDSLRKAKAAELGAHAVFGFFNGSRVRMMERQGFIVVKHFSEAEVEAIVGARVTSSTMVLKLG